MIKRLFWVLAVLLASPTLYGGTVTGTLQTPSGLPVKNGTLGFTLQQAGLINGTGAVVPSPAYCYTSNDGSVVGLPNPLSLPITSINYGSGTLPAGTYYVMYAFYAGSVITLTSPEIQVQLTGAGSLITSPPTTFPANATGMTVFIGTTSGGETGQGNTITPTSGFAQAVPLGAGIPIPATNTSLCSIAFNDTIIPYSGYNVSLISASGNAYPGWPQAWQLNGGPSGTINVSSGAPLWNGTVIYPMPILSQPLNHGPQSISGLLNMTGYNLVNVGALGVGTALPAFSIDVVGYINNTQGYLVNGGGGTSGQCLVSNGTAFLPGSCGSVPTVFYQNVQSSASFQPQRPYLNFAAPLAAVDNPSSARTDISLLNSGVTAGSYTNPNMTVDSLGRVTAASNGTVLPVIKPLVINSGICTTGTAAYASCNFAATWPSAFADTAYAITCSSTPASTGVLNALFWGNKTTTGFTLYLQNGTNAGAAATTVPEIDCIGMHP